MKELFQKLQTMKGTITDPTPELAILLGKYKKPKSFWKTNKFILKLKALFNGR